MKIVLIGAGNVASHLGPALKKAGHEIVQVYSRTLPAAEELARLLKCKYTSRSGEIDPAADVYLLSIPDHSIKSFLRSFPVRNRLVVHTSGSTGIGVFGKRFSHCGVLYPLQTFSRGRIIQFKTVPLLIEGKDRASQKSLRLLAESISGYVFEMSSAERKQVHLAAVISNNFTNHLFVEAEKILAKNNIPFLLLHPLIQETVSKAFQLSPENAQTGPAKRGDRETIQEHLRLLKKNPEMERIYRVMSAAIKKQAARHERPD